MPLCAERRVSALPPVPIHNPDHEPLPHSTKALHPPLEIQGRILPTVESSPRPPRRRGKPTTKNGEENKHSDSPDPVDDTQTVGPSTGNANIQHEEPPRPLESISHGGDYFVRSFDQIRGWWNSMERNASRAIVSTPLDLFNPLKYNDRTRISFFQCI